MDTHFIGGSVIVLLSLCCFGASGYAVGGMDHSSSGSCTYNFQVWTPNQDIINRIQMLETRHANITANIRLELSELQRALQSQVMITQNISTHSDKKLLTYQFDEVKLDLALKDMKLEMMEGKGETAKIWAFLNQIQSSMLKGVLSNHNNNNIAPTATAASDGSHRAPANNNRVISQLRNGVGDLKAEWLLIKREVQESKTEGANIRSVMSGMEEDTLTLKSDLDMVKIDIKGIKEEHRYLNKSITKLQIKLEESANRVNPDDVDWGTFPYDDEIYDGLDDLKLKYAELQEELTNITEQMAGYNNMKNTLMSSTTSVPENTHTEPDKEEHKKIAVPTDCHDIYKNGFHTSGVYKVKPTNAPYLDSVYCEMVNETGWTVIQRRQDGMLSFNRMWMEYKHGFGNLYGEFWLGNEKMHWLTSQTEYLLRIDMWDWEGHHAYAEFNYFHIGDSVSNYKLKVRGYNGNAGDSLSYHDEMAFSTDDADNDLHMRNCASENKGGWWFHSCYSSNLNGVYHTGRYGHGEHPFPDGIVWYTWKETEYYSLKKVEMKIRPYYIQ